MAAKFRVQIPPATLAALPETDGPDAVARGVDLFHALASKLRSYGAPGIHLYVISDTEGASLALKRLAADLKRDKDSL